MQENPLPSEPSNSDEPRPFGAVFLECLKEQGIPLSMFNYKTLQELKLADREATIKILRSAAGGMSYAMIQQFKKNEPEVIAQRMATQYQLAAQSASSTMLMAMLFIG